MTEKKNREIKLVRDLMSVGVDTCPEETLLKQAARLMVDKHLEAIVVLNNQGHATGVLTQIEMADAYSLDDFQNLKVSEVMRHDVPTVPADIPISAAVQIMRDTGVRVLFLTHHAGGIEYPAASLTYGQILRHMAMDDISDLDHLGIRAKRELPMETFRKRRAEALRKARGEDHDRPMEE